MSKVQIIAHLHPLKAYERDIFLVNEGTAISDILASRVKHGEPIVILNANILPSGKYDYKVKSGDHVVIKVIPQGSDLGANLVGGFMILAGLALSPFTGGASLLLSGMGLAFIGSVWTIEQLANVSTESVYGISAGQNQAAKWAGTPIILGKTKTTPRQLCAATRISGTDGEYQDILVQYLVGFGPLKISNIKLGNTLLSPNVSDVRSGLIADIEHFEGVDLEIRQGGDAPTLFPYVIHEENPGLTLYSGEEYIRETTAKCEKISVDISFSGLYKSTSSGKSSVEVKIEARYRAKGSTTAWASAPLLGYFDSGSNSIKRAKSTVIRFNAEKTILSSDSQYSATGEYEVMLKRITADSTDEAVVDLVRWTALRSVRSSQDIIAAGELQYPVTLGLAIRANNTLSGSIGKMSCIAESLVPVWDGLGTGASHWATSAISSNPAAVYLNLMRGASNPDPAPDTEIYWPAFEEWYTYCETKGWACDGVIDSFSKLEDQLIMIAATGRASPTYRDAAYSIVIDNEKTTIVQFFGPHNSRNFTWKQEYPDRPHAFRAQFKNAEQDYDSDEREVYDDGYTEANAERFETINIPYVVDGDNVWKHGRYRLAASKLRPAMYSLEAPAAAIICEPGDLIGVTHDTPMWGISDAWVKSVSLDEAGDIVGITVNNALIMEAGKTYQIIVISALGTQYTRTIETVPGENYTIAFLEAITYEDPIREGDHLFFGETGSVFARCIVVGMSPSDTDGNYIIYFVDEAPGVHTADSGTIPAWDSQVTKPGVVSPGATVDDLPVPIPGVPVAIQPQSPGILAHHSFDDGNVSGAVAVDNSGKGHHAAVADVSIIAGARGKALQIDETGTFSCDMGNADLSTGWAFGKTLCIVSGVAGHEAYSNLLTVEVWNRDSTFKRWEVSGLIVDDWYAAIVNHNGTQAELWVDSVMVGSWVVDPEEISQVLFKLTPHADIASLVHTAVDENIAYNRPLTSAEIDGYTAIGMEKKFVWADLLNEYAADGVINPQEKPGILAWFSEIDQDGESLGSYWQVRADAIAAGVSVVALDGAYNALYAYLYVMPGLLALSTWETPIVIDHSAWETVRANYYSAEAAIPGAISIANLAAANAAVPGLAPQYLGPVLDGVPAYAKEGDVYLLYSETPNTVTPPTIADPPDHRGVFRYTSSTWAWTTDLADLFKALRDIVDICLILTDDGTAPKYGVEADYGITTSIDTAHIRAAIIDMLRVGDLTLSGLLKSPILDTIAPQAGSTITNPTPSYWPGAALNTLCAGLAEGWHAVDSASTLASKTVTHCVKGGTAYTTAYQSITGGTRYLELTSGVKGKVKIWAAGHSSAGMSLYKNESLLQVIPATSPPSAFSEIWVDLGDVIRVEVVSYTVTALYLCPAANTIGVYNSTDSTVLVIDNVGYYSESGTINIASGTLATSSIDDYWKGSALAALLVPPLRRYVTNALAGGTFNGKTCANIYIGASSMTISYVSGADDVILLDGYSNLAGSIILPTVEGKLLIGDPLSEGQYEIWPHNIPGSTNMIVTVRNKNTDERFSITETRAPDQASGDTEATQSLHAVHGTNDYVRDLSLHNYAGPMCALDVLSNFGGDSLGDYKKVAKRTLTAWAGNTAYAVGDLRSNSGNAYLCVKSGTSAASGGPTTTAVVISDGTYPNDCYWQYLGAVIDGVWEIALLQLYTKNGRLWIAGGRKPTGSLHGSYAVQDLYNALAPCLEANNDEIIVHGGFNSYIASKAMRISYSTIRIYYATPTGTGYYDLTYSGGTTFNMSLSW